MAQSSKNTIETRISLTGSEEVKSAFEALGKKGQDALAALESGTKKLGSTLRGLNDQVGSVTSRFTSGLSGLTAFKGGIDSISAKFGQFTPLMNAAIPGLKLIGTLSAGAAAAGLLALGKNAANSTDELDDTATALGLTTTELQAFQLAGAQAGMGQDRLSQMLGRVTQSLGQARIDQIKLNGSVGNRITVLKGGTAAVDDFGNAVKVLKGGIHETALGAGDVVDVLRGGSKAVIDFSNPWKALGVNIGNGTLDLNKNKAATIALVEKLSGLKNESIKAAIASELFGKEWRKGLADFQQSIGALKEAENSIVKFGLVVTDEEKKQSNNFLRAFGTLEFVGDRVKTILGNIIGQALVPLMDVMKNVLVTNLGRMKAWANDISKVLTDITSDVMVFIAQGSKAEFKTAWVSGAISLLTSLKGAISLVAYGFQGLANVLDIVAAPLAYITGLNIDGKALLISAAIFQVVGGFNALASIVTIAGVLFSPTGLLLVGIAAFGIFIVEWPKILSAISDWFTTLSKAGGAWGDSLQAIGKFVQTVSDLMQGKFKQAWEDFKGFASSAINVVLVLLDSLWQKIKAVAAAIGSALGAGAQAQADNGVPPGFADGGQISGPGTGRSDSILARVSNGEFIVNAFATSRFLPLLRAINSVRGGFSGLAGTLGAIGGSLMPMPRFADGGLVGAAAAAGGGGSVTLVLDGQEYGLTGPVRTVAALARHARTRKMLSTGPAPSFVD